MSYHQVGTHRNWGIFQRGDQADFIGNMKLEYEIKGVDKPDLEADIDEAMNSKLGAFESKIVAGPAPMPTPTPAQRPKYLSKKRSVKIEIE